KEAIIAYSLRLSYAYFMRGSLLRGPTAVVAGGVFLLLALLAASVRTPDTASASAKKAARAVPNQIIVGFRSSVSPQQRTRLLDRAGASQQKAFGLLNAVVAHTSDASKTISRLESLPGVRYAQPNYILRADALSPNDPLLSQQWGLDNVGQAVGFVRGTPG